MELSKSEREEAIKKLKESTSVAKYAFYEALKKKRITDEQLLKMVEYSEVMAMLKPVISENRLGQGNRTKEANNKTKEVEKELATLKQKFVDFENSEIFQLGKWLMDKLKLSGQSRKTELAKKDLVHIQDYQSDVEDLVGTLQEHHRIANQQLSENEQTIVSLQDTIDNQTKVLLASKDKEISNRDELIRVTKEEVIKESGLEVWNKIWLKTQRRIDTDEAS